MKRILSVLKFAGLVCGGLVLLLFIVSQVMQEKVAEVVINSLNRNISTKLEAGSYRLSFLRRFPLASLELRNVLVHSSQKFDRSAFDPGTTDTLLAAPSVSVEFRLRNVLTGNYRIERIGAKSGKVILLADRAGKVNYEIAEEKGNQEEDDFRLDLERIHLSGMLASYTNLKADLLVEMVVIPAGFSQHHLQTGRKQNLINSPMDDRGPETREGDHDHGKGHREQERI
nr:hypothetical protein [Bacteroidales bacterium]